MKFLIFLFLLLFVHVDLRRHNDSNDNEKKSQLNTHHKSRLNKEYDQDLFDNEQDIPSSSFQREKKYPSRKKVLDENDNGDEIEKPIRHSQSSKTTNRSRMSNSANRVIPTTTARSYLEEAALCINEFDIKTEQLVKVKELKNGAHMIRFVRIEEPTSSHGLDIKDICMLNCCVEKNCDLAMLSEQRTNVSLFIYVFVVDNS